MVLVASHKGEGDPLLPGLCPQIHVGVLHGLSYGAHSFCVELSNLSTTLISLGRNVSLALWPWQERIFIVSGKCDYICIHTYSV